MNTLAERLWGSKATFAYLFVAASLLLFGFLGTREIWTQEHRWADIVAGMFFRGDFLHPYLNQATYYDKPLLSYWLIAIASYITGQLSTLALRLPSALAGLLAIWSIYRLGSLLKNKQMGFIAGWIMLTTFYFLFWARTSSADMLNMAGALFAVYWYVEKKYQLSFLNYAVFFLVLSFTALCKGLIGAIVPLIVIFPDLFKDHAWKKYLSFTFFISMVPAVVLYISPFIASSYFGGEHYQQNGLYLVYRENILRYFQPFDHKGPLYTYFIFLPIYLLPWSLFFIAAVGAIPARWKSLSSRSKWMVWAVTLLFLFLTLSGSRRSYYVLVLVPFAILMTADWLLDWANQSSQKQKWLGRFIGFSFLMMFLNFIVIQPLYYQKGLPSFAKQVTQEASIIKPWTTWKFVMLDPESKSRFYLRLSPDVKNFSVNGGRYHQTVASLKQACPLLESHDEDTIFISRKIYQPFLAILLPNYQIVEEQPSLVKRWFAYDEKNETIALIPKKIL